MDLVSVLMYGSSSMPNARLKRLELQDFRGFSSLALEFEDDLTVIVGPNGAGKTTIIDAIAYANMTWRGGPGNAMDIRRGATKALVHLFGSNAHGTEWTRGGETAIQPGGYVRRVPNRSDGISPHVFIYRVDRHTNDRTPGTTKPRSWTSQDALAHWENASAQYDAFFVWFKEMEDLENEQVRYEQAHENRELAAVRRAIMAFLPEFNEIRVRRRMLPMADKPVLMLRKGQVELPFDALSEGERTTIALVGDIARRLALLGERDNPLETPVTVIIDELEQHAHPGWQRRLLERFRNTFPNLQLITTTQSPIIVSEIEPRQLRVLRDFQLVQTEHGPGRDANTVLEDVFDVAPRNRAVQDALDELAEAIEDDELERADAMLARLDELIPGGADPDIVYYRNLLERLREP